MKTPKHTVRSWGTGLVVLSLIAAAPILLTLQGCTDLDEDTFGAITPSNFYQTEAEFVAALAPVYANLRDVQWDYWWISEIATDEMVIPTRGTDWDDGGAWRALHQHNWDETLGQVNGAWNFAFTGIARANTVLDNLATSPTELDQKDAFTAELRTLRAFYYYTLMDLYGGVPIVETPSVDPKNPPARNSREEVFQFIETELKEALPNLVPTAVGSDYGRVTQGAARAILANMYLNSEVFTGSVSAGGLQRGSARWQDALSMADEILNSGNYSLASNYFQNFAVANYASPENIMVATFKAKGGLGFAYSMRTLHYNQIPQSPWNGFSTLAEVWNSFSEDDARKKMFLEGQQFESPNAGCTGSDCFSQGEPLQDRQGNPLIFTANVPLTGATEANGIRVLKWELDAGQTGGDMGNDYPIFRLAEIYLIKAEALNELGRTAEAVQVLNVIRDRAGVTPLNAGDFNQSSLREAILEERLHELLGEAKRRQDLIRHGTFTSGQWEHKAPSEPFRVLYPIPQPQLDSNPNLTQNPGY